MSKTAPNFTQIPNILLDEWLPTISSTASVILLIIARQTYGWILDTESNHRKKMDWIAYSQLCEKTGRQKEAISRGLKELEEKGYILITDSNSKPILKEQRSGKRLYYRINYLTSSETEEVENVKAQPVRKPNFGNRTSETEQTKETNTKETIQNLVSKDTRGVSPLELNGFGNPDINEGILLLRDSGISSKEQMNRYALKRLYAKHGKEKVLKVFRWAVVIRTRSYAPAVFNYMDLEEKWPSLEAYAVRQTQKDPSKKGVIDARGI